MIPPDIHYCLNCDLEFTPRTLDPNELLCEDCEKRLEAEIITPDSYILHKK
jgi:DNA-directed RNA polymerase alpha subunit